ncbi:MAG: hypothetical protein IJD43_04160, partial [Thermoguttaceae bacterium]|nr:hypothetical protein [Thermoguttaceae bacterium]
MCFLRMGISFPKLETECFHTLPHFRKAGQQKEKRKNKKAQKQFKKFLKRESEGGTTFKMFLPHGRGDMTGSQFGRRRVSRRFWEAV